MPQRLPQLRRAAKASGCAAFLGWRVGLPKLRPYHLVGLVDAEGSFFIQSHNSRPIFQLMLNVKEYPLLEAARKLLHGYGSVSVTVKKHAVAFRIACKRGLLHVVEFFRKYPLVTTKCHDFERWQRCVELYCSQQHLTYSGRKEIGKHDDQMNQRKMPHLLSGLQIHGIPCSQAGDWMSGFTSGEGSFHLVRTHGYLRFSLEQSAKDKAVLEYARDLIQAGAVREFKGMATFRIESARQLPLVQSYFTEHELIGSKLADYLAWSDLLDLMVYEGSWRSSVHVPKATETYAQHLWNRGARLGAGTLAGHWKDLGRRRRFHRAQDLSGDPLYKMLLQ